MKKLFSISLLFSVAAMMFTGCVSEEDDLFDSSAAERLMTSKNMYTDRLGGSTWVMEFYPLNTDEAPKGQGYLILNKFNRDGSVVQAMQNELTDGQYLTDTSLWEVISDQGTVLTFNTFNKCIHMFSDPGLYQTGQGFEGDYEFVILSLEEGAKYGMLKGKKRATYNRLTRLPDDINFEEYLKDVTNFNLAFFPESAVNNSLFKIKDSLFVISELYTGIMAMYPYGGDPITQTEYHAYTTMKDTDGFYFRFREKLDIVDGVSVQLFKFDEAACEFVCVDEGNPESKIFGYNKVDFFMEQLEIGHIWNINTNAVISDKFKEHITVFDNAFKKNNISYRGLRLLKYAGKDGEPDRYVWRLAYQQKGKGVSNLNYYYNVTPNGQDVRCHYEGPETSAGEQMLNVIDGISQVLTNDLSQEFVVESYTNAFVLNTLKFISVSDPDIWFTISLN